MSATLLVTPDMRYPISGDTKTTPSENRTVYYYDFGDQTEIVVVSAPINTSIDTHLGSVWFISANCTLFSRVLRRFEEFFVHWTCYVVGHSELY